MSQEPETFFPKVILMQCGRRSCGHVLLDTEREWIPNGIGETACCPKCGEEGFYHLNELGQTLKMSQREQYRHGVDPHLINPSTRMGLKMRRRIFAVKARALATLDQQKAPQQ